MATLYDNIGRDYAGQRQSDPRIGTTIEDALAGCETILNVGAGAGSYEPRSRMVIAVEPSWTMIAQRPVGAAAVVQAYAEGLPFQNGSFDAVLGILTVHHWNDQAKGFAECGRVARSRVVFLTNDFDVCKKFWLFDYVPELLRADRHIFPSIARFEDAFGSVETIAVPVPADCLDGFLGAYWKRPSAYLDPIVRASISTFSKIGNIDAELADLQRDIDSGSWAIYIRVDTAAQSHRIGFDICVHSPTKLGIPVSQPTRRPVAAGQIVATIAGVSDKPHLCVCQA